MENKWIEVIEEYRNKSTNIELPPPNMQKLPSQASFSDDISDDKLFNDRFIESHISEGMSAFPIYLMMMGVNLITVMV